MGCGRQLLFPLGNLTSSAIFISTRKFDIFASLMKHECGNILLCIWGLLVKISHSFIILLDNDLWNLQKARILLLQQKLSLGSGRCSALYIYKFNIKEYIFEAEYAQYSIMSIGIFTLMDTTSQEPRRITWSP